MNANNTTSFDFTMAKLRGAIIRIKTIQIADEKAWRDFAARHKINVEKDCLIVADADFPETPLGLLLPKWVKRSCFIRNGEAYIIKNSLKIPQ